MVKDTNPKKPRRGSPTTHGSLDLDELGTTMPASNAAATAANADAINRNIHSTGTITTEPGLATTSPQITPQNAVDQVQLAATAESTPPRNLEEDLRRALNSGPSRARGFLNDLLHRGNIVYADTHSLDETRYFKTFMRNCQEIAQHIELPNISEQPERTLAFRKALTKAVHLARKLNHPNIFADDFATAFADHLKTTIRDKAIFHHAQHPYQTKPNYDWLDASQHQLDPMIETTIDNFANQCVETMRNPSVTNGHSRQ